MYHTKQVKQVLKFHFCSVEYMDHVIVVPTSTGKPRKVGKHFPVREKSENFGQTGKVREFYTKYWKCQRILDNLNLFCNF